MLVVLGGCSGGDGASTVSPPSGAGATSRWTSGVQWSEEETATVEAYVDAWNAEDVDAIMALYAEPVARGDIESRCTYEEIFQHRDVTLAINPDANTIVMTGLTNEPIEEDIQETTAHGPGDSRFAFTDDGLLVTTLVTGIVFVPTDATME